jgi:NitT/TauT family transport system permease protein
MATLESQSKFPGPARGAAPAVGWRRLAARAAVPLSLLAGLLAWEAVVRLSQLPSFVLPAPAAVGRRLVEALEGGWLLWHAGITLGEVLGGLALGLAAASALGYVVARSPGLERVLTPYIVASQAVPIVAIAPLLVLWFGVGLRSKILICALIVFFPILINTVVGLRSVEPDLRDLMRTLRASRWQTFAKLDVPSALPIWLGGVRVGATLAVIGAVVGEFVGADRGLGFLINFGRGQYDTALVLVAAGTLVVMALALYGAVAACERALLAWRETSDG